MDKITLPNQLDIDLAEEIGIHVGDGSMNIYKKAHMYSLEGDILEKDYYINFIAPLFKKIYNLDVRLRERKCAGVFGFQKSSRELILFKNKQFNLPLGSKCNIEIPLQIRNSSLEIKKAFLRGFFDTDGGIYLEKKYGKPYPRIILVNKSMNLMNQIKEILVNDFNFNLSMWRDKFCYRINIRGNKNFIKWMKLIGSHNPKNINKYSNWFYQAGETLNLEELNFKS